MFRLRPKYVTRLPLKASEFYANYLFKFLQIETLILVKIPTQMNLLLHQKF